MESAVTKVVVSVGTDGDAYYTGHYANGEPGPRSEGYAPDDRLTSQAARDHSAIAVAVDAAARDFPDAEVVVETA
jgi:hypothetical protein